MLPTVVIPRPRSPASQRPAHGQPELGEVSSPQLALRKSASASARPHGESAVPALSIPAISTSTDLQPTDMSCTCLRSARPLVASTSRLSAPAGVAVRAIHAPSTLPAKGRVPPMKGRWRIAYVGDCRGWWRGGEVRGVGWGVQCGLWSGKGTTGRGEEGQNQTNSSGHKAGRCSTRRPASAGPLVWSGTAVRRACRLSHSLGLPRRRPLLRNSPAPSTPGRAPPNSSTPS